MCVYAYSCVCISFQSNDDREISVWSNLYFFCSARRTYFLFISLLLRDLNCTWAKDVEVRLEARVGQDFLALQASQRPPTQGGQDRLPLEPQGPPQTHKYRARRTVNKLIMGVRTHFFKTNLLCFSLLVLMLRREKQKKYETRKKTPSGLCLGV